MLERVEVNPGPTNKGKRFVATFSNGKRVFFGQAGGETYIDHKDKKRRESYRARHKHDRIHEPMTPGALSWHLLWGEHTTLAANIKAYRRAAA